ncbi:Syntaxin-like protein, partial [Globisporangium splendens]
MAENRTADFRQFCHKYAQQQKPSTVPQENVQFNAAASDISKEVYQASQRLQQLTQLVRQNNMFNDPTEAINELAALVKKDITDINAQLDNLQEYINSKRSANGSKQAATHSDAIVSLMKSNLMVTTKGFKDILEVRQENMKLQQNRRARYGKTASSALGKPLAFRAPPPAPSSRSDGSEVNLNNTLPRPDGIQSSDGGSEIMPLISMMSQEQVVAEQQNYTESRAEAVSQIESHIVDIGQMFGRLATILHEQEDLVRRIDDNVDDTLANIEEEHAGVCVCFFFHFDSWPTAAYLIFLLQRQHGSERERDDRCALCDHTRAHEALLGLAVGSLLERAQSTGEHGNCEQTSDRHQRFFRHAALHLLPTGLHGANPFHLSSGRCYKWRSFVQYHGFTRVLARVFVGRGGTEEGGGETKGEEELLSLPPHNARRPFPLRVSSTMFKLRQQVVRRAVVAQRAIEWDAISQKLTDPRARAALDSLRNVHGEIQAEAREYLKEPEAIDFDYYRSVIKNKDLVNALEENYKSIAFPTITPEELDTSEINEKETVDQLFAQLNEKVDDSKKRIVELQELIGLMEETRTTLDTTVDEIAAMYPEVSEEIDDEIANYDWEKDTQG